MDFLTIIKPVFPRRSRGCRHSGWSSAFLLVTRPRVAEGVIEALSFGGFLVAAAAVHVGD